MASYNKVILMGNIVRDPELRYIPSGSAVCEFSIAVNRQWTEKSGEKKEEVGFFDCVAWARTAEVIGEYCKKGKPIFVEGRLQQDRWQDKTSGQNRSRVRITVERMQFLGGGQRQEGTTEEAPATDQMPDENVPF